MVCEGDTVVYRTGSWYVDGVLVGEEDAVAEYKLCRVDTIQVVWTHNCQHGVLRGLAVDIKNDADGEEETNKGEQSRSVEPLSRERWPNPRHVVP